ncbi:GNAT family N-acetyltransferase [Kineosporia succinea]|uniref:GNAT superfamily N-acetyltransferase n=1 Tax=Kineosporia succinea TaxID=84632 RepID=A0ABT9NXB2_9ACTN|nr:GNAT family N-acetyltransferase [Kineosporia succinea]MDP9825069.1 GNAT superfamily N-acetyltransferase [Kineosporia succinea]
MSGEALRSERLLFPDAREVTTDQIGKTLLTRPTRPPLKAPETLALEPVDWPTYTTHRIEVEAGFGVDARGARAMVRGLRERCARLGLVMMSAHDHQERVGAIGWFSPHPGWARLQEVDVFPAHRGHGYGDALLAATFQHLDQNGVHTVIVGADEDDWPLSWYRRRGFEPVTRVTRSRG